MLNDTIAAIATAVSPSGIGIIRVSGKDAVSIVDKIYKSPNNGKRLSLCKSHTVHYGFIYDDQRMIDEVMVILMKAPNSYTKEDTVEIDCHGGVFVMKKILETVIKYGARPAESGEFTKRAFLNGRIDLTQAESVMDLIQSKNDFALSSSLSQLRGSIKNDIKKIRKDLIHEIAFIESALDDPEYISFDGYKEILSKIIDEKEFEITSLLNKYDNGRMRVEGILTVIIGKPNAGKSSLLNFMLGEERAIVTDIAGTTRDILEEQINLGGITLRIMDTAGIRNADNIVEEIGVKKAKEYASKADLILYVIDSSTSLDENDFEIINLLDEKKSIVLLNKTDLRMITSQEEVEKYINSKVLLISAKEEQGMDDLEKVIKEMFFNNEIAFNDEIYITNIRQKTALQEARDSLHLVRSSIDDGMPEDFYSIDLMNAYEALGTIIGEAIEDDLANEIFSKFCMGK